MAGITIKAEYNGYEIEWSDYQRFSIVKDNAIYKSSMQTLQACQEWIDKRNKQKFNRVKVFYSGRAYKDKIREGEATSLVDDEYVWVVSGQNRSKEKIGTVILDTPENRVAIETVNQKEAAIKTLETDITVLYKSMSRLTPEMMVEGTDSK